MKTTQTLVVVMGVSGSGKSTVAQAIAKELGCEFVEADDFHPQENRNHMANGMALTDAMREPWIALLQAHLKQAARASRSCTLSFSGLRRSHRAKIKDLPFNTLFIHLEGDQQVIADRINKRSGHFMPVKLLDSQYAALELPQKKEAIVSININQDLESVIQQSISAVEAYFKHQNISIKQGTRKC